MDRPYDAGHDAPSFSETFDGDDGDAYGPGLTGLAEHEDHERNAALDDHRERYGDPCPGCRTLRWQGDCPKCYREEDL